MDARAQQMLSYEGSRFLNTDDFPRHFFVVLDIADIAQHKEICETVVKFCVQIPNVTTDFLLAKSDGTVTSLVNVGTDRAPGITKQTTHSLMSKISEVTENENKKYDLNSNGDVKMEDIKLSKILELYKLKKSMFSEIILIHRRTVRIDSSVDLALDYQQNFPINLQLHSLRFSFSKEDVNQMCNEHLKLYNNLNQTYQFTIPQFGLFKVISHFRDLYEVLADIRIIPFFRWGQYHKNLSRKHHKMSVIEQSNSQMETEDEEEDMEMVFENERNKTTNSKKENGDLGEIREIYADEGGRKEEEPQEEEEVDNYNYYWDSSPGNDPFYDQQ